MYTLEYAEGVAGDLKKLRAYERKRILDKIEKQLTVEPTRKTRNRKIFVGLVPPWEYIEPVWELRAGEYRVFYDVDEQHLRCLFGQFGTNRRIKRRRKSYDNKRF